MTLLLAGDIGGTKTLLQLVEKRSDRSLITLHESSFSSYNYSDLVELVREFLGAASSFISTKLDIDSACFGIAGPVVNNNSELTNLKWSLQGDRLASELNIPKVSLINDFAAIGYGVLGLESADIFTLQAGKPQERSPIAVIGAGTGLGEGFLTWSEDNYQVYPSEGGHTDFAPRNQIEIALLNYLLTKYKRVSVERIVSGIGIVAIYQFLCDYHQVDFETNLIAKTLRAWERKEIDLDMAAAIANAALNNTDAHCVEAMQIFVECYGAEAGNLALKLLPYSGLYIAGGIAAKILPLIQKGNFISAFKLKGRVSPLLDDVPVHIVLNQKVGLIGAALYASRS